MSNERLTGIFSVTFNLAPTDLTDLQAHMNSLVRMPEAWHDDPTRLSSLAELALSDPAVTNGAHPMWDFMYRAFSGHPTDKPVPVGIVGAAHTLLRARKDVTTSKTTYGYTLVDIQEFAFTSLLRSWTTDTSPAEVENIQVSLSDAPAHACTYLPENLTREAIDFLSDENYANYESVAGALTGMDYDPQRLARHIATSSPTSLHRLPGNRHATPELLQAACQRVVTEDIPDNQKATVAGPFWTTGDSTLMGMILASPLFSPFFTYAMNRYTYDWRNFFGPLAKEENAHLMRAVMNRPEATEASLPNFCIAAISNPGITSDECDTLIDGALTHAKNSTKWQFDTTQWVISVISAIMNHRRDPMLMEKFAVAAPWHPDMENSFRRLIAAPELSIEQLEVVAKGRRKSAKATVLKEIERRGVTPQPVVETPSRPRVEPVAPTFESSEMALQWVGSTHGFTPEGACAGIQAALTNMETPVRVRQELAGMFAHLLNSNPSMVSDVLPDTWKLLFRFKSSIELEKEALLLMLACGEEEAERYAGKKIADSLAA